MNCSVVATVKLQEWNVAATRVTWYLHGVGVTGRCIDIKGTGDGGKCCNPARHFLVASQDVTESSTIRLSGGKDSRRINAILLLNMVEDICGELEVVYGIIRNALPKVLQLCQH